MDRGQGRGHLFRHLFHHWRDDPAQSAVRSDRRRGNRRGHQGAGTVHPRIRPDRQAIRGNSGLWASQGVPIQAWQIACGQFPACGYQCRPAAGLLDLQSPIADPGHGQRGRENQQGSDSHRGFSGLRIGHGNGHPGSGRGRRRNRQQTRTASTGKGMAAGDGRLWGLFAAGGPGCAVYRGPWHPDGRPSGSWN